MKIRFVITNRSAGSAIFTKEVAAMDVRKHQSWEGEFEAAELDEEAKSVFPMIFAAMIGICIFSILVLKTMCQQFFRARKPEFSRRISSAPDTFDRPVAHSK
ncbi:MAG TPA: hypothetical protein VEB86_01605 [Chryseosolibacter sp.]|nr:hypothetical protein [Chryseosolibacter sp.]